MPSTGKGSRQGDLRRFRSEVAKLKHAGILSQRVDARSQKPTRYMRERIEKYRDVLEGKAAAVKVPPKVAREYKDTHRTTRGRVVIPLDTKNEKVRYSAKDRAIITQRDAYGRRIKKLIVPRPRGIDDLPKGRKLRYRVDFKHGGMVRFNDLGALKGYMSEYKKFGNWLDYVSIEEVSDLDDLTEDEGYFGADEVGEAA